jgi:hypothetical protein
MEMNPPQLYDYARKPEIPEEVGNLARTLATGKMYKEADELLQMHEVYTRTVNYYRMLASTVGMEDPLNRE